MDEMRTSASRSDSPQRSNIGLAENPLSQPPKQLYQVFLSDYYVGRVEVPGGIGLRAGGVNAFRLETRSLFCVENGVGISRSAR
jgi:hypothetical protein